MIWWAGEALCPNSCGQTEVMQCLDPGHSYPLSHHGDLWPHPDPWWLPMGWGERASQAPPCPVGVGRGSNIGRWTSKPTGPCWGPQEISACFSGCFRRLTQLQCLLSLSLAIKQMYMKKNIFHLSSWPKVCVCVCVWERERERERETERGNRQNRLYLESRTPSWARQWTLSYMPSIYGNNTQTGKPGPRALP